MGPRDTEQGRVDFDKWTSKSSVKAEGTEAESTLKKQFKEEMTKAKLQTRPKSTLPAKSKVAEPQIDVSDFKKKREAEMAAQLSLQHSHSSISQGAPRSSASPNASKNGNTPLQSQRQTPSVVTIDLSEYAEVEAGYPCSKAALGIEPDIPVPMVNDLAKPTDSAMGDLGHSPDDLFKPASISSGTLNAPTVSLVSILSSMCNGCSQSHKSAQASSDSFEGYPL